MSVDRIERVNALLLRVVSEAFPKVLRADELNLAALTVTQVVTARNLRNATISVSILGHEKQRHAIIAQLNHKAPEIQSIVNREMTLKYTPRLRFVLDPSIEKGDKVLALLDRLSQETDAPAAQE